MNNKKTGSKLGKRFSPISFFIYREKLFRDRSRRGRETWTFSSPENRRHGTTATRHCRTRVYTRACIRASGKFTRGSRS